MGASKWGTVPTPPPRRLMYRWAEDFPGKQGQPLLARVLPATHRGLAAKPQGPSRSESPLPNLGLYAADKVNNGGGARGLTALSETHADSTLTTSDSAAGSGQLDPGWAWPSPSTWPSSSGTQQGFLAAKHSCKSREGQRRNSSSRWCLWERPEQAKN